MCVCVDMASSLLAEVGSQGHGVRSDWAFLSWRLTRPCQVAHQSLDVGQSRSKIGVPEWTVHQKKKKACSAPLSLSLSHPHPHTNSSRLVPLCQASPADEDPTLPQNWKPEANGLPTHKDGQSSTALPTSTILVTSRIYIDTFFSHREVT